MSNIKLNKKVKFNQLELKKSKKSQHHQQWFYFAF